MIKNCYSKCPGLAKMFAWVFPQYFMEKYPNELLTNPIQKALNTQPEKKQTDFKKRSKALTDTLPKRIHK